MSNHRVSFSHAAGLLAVLLAVSGCAASSQNGDSSDLGKSEGKKSGKNKGQLTPSAEIARLQIERDRLAQNNELLEQELADAHEDLKNVERQFIVYEERLTADDGKAAAVASAAEARIRCERMVRERPGLMADSTKAYVKGLIETSENLIRKQNYPAAQFFAERANHTMNSAERRANVEGKAVTRAVAADVANVRVGPGQGYAVVERVSQGARLTCWGEANEWFHVRTPNGAEGWIHVSVLR